MRQRSRVKRSSRSRNRVKSQSRNRVKSRSRSRQRAIVGRGNNLRGGVDTALAKKVAGVTAVGAASYYYVGQNRKRKAQQVTESLKAQQVAESLKAQQVAEGLNAEAEKALLAFTESLKTFDREKLNSFENCVLQIQNIDESVQINTYKSCLQLLEPAQAQTLQEHVTADVFVKIVKSFVEFDLDETLTRLDTFLNSNPSKQMEFIEYVPDDINVIIVSKFFVKPLTPFLKHIDKFNAEFVLRFKLKLLTLKQFFLEKFTLNKQALKTNLHFLIERLPFKSNRDDGIYYPKNELETLLLTSQHPKFIVNSLFELTKLPDQNKLPVDLKSLRTALTYFSKLNTNQLSFLREDLPNIFLNVDGDLWVKEITKSLDENKQNDNFKNALNIFIKKFVSNEQKTLAPDQFFFDDTLAVFNLQINNFLRAPFLNATFQVNRDFFHKIILQLETKLQTLKRPSQSLQTRSAQQTQ